MSMASNIDPMHNKESDAVKQLRAKVAVLVRDCAGVPTKGKSYAKEVEKRAKDVLATVTRSNYVTQGQWNVVESWQNKIDEWLVRTGDDRPVTFTVLPQDEEIAAVGAGLPPLHTPQKTAPPLETQQRASNLPGPVAAILERRTASSAAPQAVVEDTESTEAPFEKQEETWEMPPSVSPSRKKFPEGVQCVNDILREPYDSNANWFRAVVSFDPYIRPSEANALAREQGLGGLVGSFHDACKWWRVDVAGWLATPRAGGSDRPPAWKTSWGTNPDTWPKSTLRDVPTHPVMVARIADLEAALEEALAAAREGSTEDREVLPAPSPMTAPEPSPAEFWRVAKQTFEWTRLFGPDGTWVQIKRALTIANEKALEGEPPCSS